MAFLQRQFEQFHATIRMDYDHNNNLVTKRDMLLEEIKDHLKSNERPGFTRILQGSYKMRTGVKPTGAKEYDIDVGLSFEFATGMRPEAGEIRSWVLSAVSRYASRTVIDKGPCIRVAYADGYHVDLVVYAAPTAGDPKFLDHKERGWINAEPVQLLKYVDDACSKFSGSEGGAGLDQLRRVVRYLKRWDDFTNPVEGSDKPAGLAYTLLTIDSLKAPVFAVDTRLDDALALRSVADESARTTRISAIKPTPEYEDMFSRLSPGAHTRLQKRFVALREALDFARSEPDTRVACQRLADVSERTSLCQTKTIKARRPVRPLL